MITPHPTSGCPRTGCKFSHESSIRYTTGGLGTRGEETNYHNSISCADPGRINHLKLPRSSDCLIIRESQADALNIDSVVFTRNVTKHVEFDDIFSAFFSQL